MQSKILFPSNQEQNNVIDISFINKIIKSSINKFKLKNNEQEKKSQE